MKSNDFDLHLAAMQQVLDQYDPEDDLLRVSWWGRNLALCLEAVLLKLQELEGRAAPNPTASAADETIPPLPDAIQHGSQFDLLGGALNARLALDEDERAFKELVKNAPAEPAYFATLDDYAKHLEVMVAHEKAKEILRENITASVEAIETQYAATVEVWPEKTPLYYNGFILWFGYEFIQVIPWEEYHKQRNEGKDAFDIFEE